MANVDIRNFVKINIEHDVTQTVNSTRDTVVLLTTESSLDEKDYEEYSSISEYIKGKFYLAGADTESNTYKYVVTYFNNGGVKVRVIKIETYGSAANFANGVETLLKTLADKYIVIGYAGDNTSFMTTLAAKLTTDSDYFYGVKQKIILARAQIDDEITIPDGIANINNLALKFSKVIGTEMTIGAYLSKINMDNTNSIQDYAFTREFDGLSEIEEDITDDQFNKITTNNCNVDINLAGFTRNCGGNLTNGLDLVNQYTLIVLHQVLTNKTLEVIASKVKGQEGLDAIHTALVTEMNKFILNGYLSTDKIWTDDSLVISYGDQTYTIIETNTPLASGYKIVILPIFSLTAEDIKNHSTPPIYVVLADSYGIRKVTIEGKII